VSTGTDGRTLAVENLVKDYADRKQRVRAVDGVSFEVQEGHFYTLLGPSGCGKTTTLRCVAGLERTDGGRIVVDGRLVSSDRPRVFVSPHQRDIGMVFQSYAIWPHLTVFENVAFPMRVAGKRVSQVEIKSRVEEALALVQLSGYEARMATRLSGGQQQRLALARALVRRPKVLLLDEPLSNLDAKLRERMRNDVRDLQRQLGITALYVTHDQIEALSMSNRIAVMSHGKIIQEGTPREIYEHPSTQFVAHFVGSTNLIEAEVLGPADLGGMQLRTQVGLVRAHCPTGVSAGDKVTISIRPENIQVHRSEPAEMTNVLPGEVEQVTFLGEFLDCRIRVGGARLFTRLHPMLAVRQGDKVFVEIPSELLAVLSDTHGLATSPYAREAQEDELEIEAATT
jgi:iron(III) transport system ATP-binding protein